ncbi:MAG: hypothetical protein D6798_01750 [Deltaproteobacteria bacterium]|nr:MAG: hypothetical protein D6798_01750 [Deltaproteobacteria bacterium]
MSRRSARPPSGRRPGGRRPGGRQPGGRTRRFVATCPQGLEPVLATELEGLGLGPCTPRRGAVAFRGPLSAGYRACLWSRVASRVLVQLGEGPAQDSDALYRTVRGIPWRPHLGPDHTLAVDFVGGNAALRHTGFGARRTKDAICDQLRAATGRRPSIDLEHPDIRVHVHVAGEHCTVSLDLAGDPLHRRSAGVEGGRAPLKETLAAALLLLADWPAAAAAGRALVDPMCGSGSFLREGLAMAVGLPPGLPRRRWGFDRWRAHDRALWEGLVAEARATPRRPPPPVFGYDRDPGALETACAGLAGLGLGEAVRLLRVPLALAEPPTEQPGFVITNPPYGARLGSVADAEAVMALLGDVLRRRFLGWRAFVLTGSPRLARRLGLRPARRIPVWNGRIECRFLDVPISSRPVERDRPDAGPVG